MKVHTKFLAGIADHWNGNNQADLDEFCQRNGFKPLAFGTVGDRQGIIIGSDIKSLVVEKGNFLVYIPNKDLYFGLNYDFFIELFQAYN